VAIAYPPPGFKDVRELLNGRKGDLAAGRLSPADLGAEFATWCASSCRPIGGAADTTAVTAAATSGDADALAARLAGAVDRDYRPLAPPPVDVCPTPARIVLHHAANNRLQIVLIGCGRLTCPHCCHGKRALYLETIARRLADAEIDGLEGLYIAHVPPAEWERVGTHLSRAKADYFRVLLPSGDYLLASTAPPPAGAAEGVTYTTLAEARARLRVAVTAIPLTAGGVFASSRRWRLLNKDERGEPLGWVRVGLGHRDWQNVTDAHGIYARPVGARNNKFPERMQWVIDLGGLPRGLTYTHLVSDLEAGIATVPSTDTEGDAGGVGPAPIDYTTYATTF
jgi:hypothetical protein